MPEPDAAPPALKVVTDGVSVETRYAHLVAMAEEGLIAQGLVDPGSFNATVPLPDGTFFWTMSKLRRHWSGNLLG